MSTKFFTNEDGNTLFEKFKGAFTHTLPINQFDALVGYFRASGYFRLRPYLDNMSQIRILVGINVDTTIAKSAALGHVFHGINQHETVNKFKKMIDNEIKCIAYDRKEEISISQFIEDIKSGKVEIRAHPSKKLHAKIYILRPDNFDKNNCYGEVISGSSNLSASGLGIDNNNYNYEFNVSLRDYDDIMFATDEFLKLWHESFPVLEDDYQEVIDNSHLSRKITPEMVFYKFLIENLEDEIIGSEIVFPKGLMELTYQKEAVVQGLKLIDKYNGFFLSDVVGLGKTFMSMLLAQEYFKRHNLHHSYKPGLLIVTPPALQKNWKDVDNEYDFHLHCRIKFITPNSLHKIKDSTRFDMVIIDESHKFKSHDTEMYKLIQNLCKTPNQSQEPKKIILVSATPLNNKPSDLHNQLLLFQDNYQPTLEINGTLADYFGRKNKEYDQIVTELKEHGHFISSDEIKRRLDLVYDDIRENIVEPIIVRRTRIDIMTDYKEDLKKQNITFPKVNQPKMVYYQMDKILSKLYSDTMVLINNSETGLKYAKQRVYSYLRKDDLNQNRLNQISNQLTALMKTMLLKRLDSSFNAFIMTLKRFRDANKEIISASNNNNEINIHQEAGETSVVDDDIVDLLKTSSDHLRTVKLNELGKNFLTDIGHDYSILCNLYDRWKTQYSDYKNDPKINNLIERMNDMISSSGKVIVFTESSETGTYISNVLSDLYGVLNVNSQNRTHVMSDVISNFDARVNKTHQKNDYNILVTTEVLSEGVGLHRADTIVNYDTPWNSTRLKQRIGRVNRIGTTAKEIHIFNFVPSIEVDNEITLSKRAKLKLFAFHKALGEDSQVFSVDEETGSNILYEKETEFDMNSENYSKNKQYYMRLLRNLKRNKPNEYQTMKNLPDKIRVAVKGSNYKNATLVFIKYGKKKISQLVDEKYREGGGGEKEFIPFVRAAKILEDAIHCKPISELPEFHYNDVNLAENNYKQSNNRNHKLHDSSQLLRTEKNALRILLTLKNINKDKSKDLLYNELISSIKQGATIDLPKRIKKACDKCEDNIVDLDNQIQIIGKDYRSMNLATTNVSSVEEPVVLLSETFTS